MTEANGSKRDRFKKFFQKQGPQKSKSEDGKLAAGSSTPHDLPEDEIKDPSSRLWLKAYQGLRKSESELIETYEKLLTEETKDISDGISQIAAFATNCFIDCTQQQLVGQMRLVAEKSINKANRHSKTKDGVVQTVEFVNTISKACSSLLQAFPPAAMACSGVCIILPLLIQPFKADKAMITGLDYVISRMEWYMNLHRLVFQDDHDGKLEFASVRKSIEESTIKLYQSLMKYEIQCAFYCFRDHPIVKITKAVLDPENWKNRLQEIKDLEATIIGDMSRYSSQETIEYLKGTSINIVNIEKYLQDRKDQDDLDRIEWAAKERQAKERNQHELTGLFNTTAYKKRMEFNRKRVPGTCEWFQTHSEFERWLTGQTGLLLVSADPGCGKSVLASYLIENVLPEKHPEATICYFFFKDNPEQRDFANGFCAILHRLFFENSFLAEYCQDLISKYKSTLQSDSTALWEIFEKAVGHPDAGQIICVFDALDECDPEGFCELLQTLERVLQSQSSISTSENRKVKFLMTTRGYPAILEAFKDFGPAYLHLSGDSTAAKTQIQKEINLVVEFRLAELSKKKGLSLERQELIRDSLMQQAGDYEQRTYLWVYLLFEVLQRNFDNTARKWMQLINNPPDTVNKAYEQLLSRVQSDEIDLVRVLLHLTIAAVRPLTLKEMNMAVHVRNKVGTYPEVPLDLPSEEDFRKLLISACGFFLTVYDERIFFIHQTAKEFLLRDDKDDTQQSTSSQWHKSITNFQAHRSMAESSVALLSNEELSARDLSDWADRILPIHFEPTPIDLENLDRLYDDSDYMYDEFPERIETTVYDDSFLSYVLDYWLWHFECAQEFDGSSLLRDIDNTFLPSYFSLFDDKPPLSMPWLLLTLINDTKIKSMADLDRFFSWTDIISPQSVNAKWHEYITVADIAAFYGHYRLLKYCAENKEFRRGSFVQLNNREKPRARYHMQETELLESLIMPIFLATLSSSCQCLEYLIQISQGVAVSVRDKKNKTPLLKAVDSRCFEAIRLLIDRGAEINAKDDDGYSIVDSFRNFSMYSGKGYSKEELDVWKFIISKGANLNSTDKDKYSGKTILHYASGYIWEDFPEFEALNRPYLLRKEKLHKQEMFVEYEEEIFVPDGKDILVENGRVIFFEDEMAIQKIEKIVRVLEICHPTVELNLSSEAAFLSAYNRSFIKFLLDHSADLNKQSPGGSTPLHMACDQKNIWNCAFLLHSGVNTEVTNYKGRTPLHEACDRGEVVIMRLLLKYGASVAAIDSEGLSPLHVTCITHPIGIDRILCELVASGADVNLRSPKGSTALHLICHNRSKDSSQLKGVEFLLDERAEINAQDDDGATPLHEACSGNFESFVELLLNRGADANAQDKEGRTPLHIAVSEYDRPEIVKLLLSSGADVNAQDKEGATPLHEVCAWLGHEADIVELLLDGGADVNIRDNNAATPLGIVREDKGEEEFNERTVKLLLEKGAKE